MTRDEFIAVRFASQKRIALQRARIEQIKDEHDAACQLALEEPKEVLERLRVNNDTEHDACLTQLDFIPFKKHDFITNGNGDYYEVATVEVNVSSIDATELEPDADFLRILIRAYKIRKSGTLAEYYTQCRPDRGYRKAEMSEDICLRRAVKQRMRRRLEGGD